MQASNEELELSSTSNETLSDIRGHSLRCRILLNRLSANDDAANTGGEAGELIASFNIWAANMGVFRDGQQSINTRLKSAPQISELVQQLLVALERGLERECLQEDEKEGFPSDTESKSSSDRSSASSYRLVSLSDDDEEDPHPLMQPRRTIWASIRGTITILQNLASALHLAGAQHRQERIQRFKNLDRNKQVFELVERCARQTVDFRFPKATVKLCEQMAESVATRRARFLYLEQHQKKTSTLQEVDPGLDQARTIEGQRGYTGIQVRQQPEAISQLPQTGNGGPGLYPTMAASTTVDTKLDPKQLQACQKSTKRPESVTSVKISTGDIPSRPKLDPGGTSFTCPYCFLVCPADEASNEKQWISHLIHDFEPFFCVIDDCHSPFICAGTYTGWLTHMKEVHTKPRWHCWHCQATTPFLSSDELETHLKEYHHREVTETLRPTIIGHSLVYDQQLLQDCPFCGGFPEEIEKDHPDRDEKQAREALEKHTRDHLVSVALLLAPVKAGGDDIELDDTQSEAQRGNDSERDLDDVSQTYVLECQNDDCDCKEKEQDSPFVSPAAPFSPACIEDIQSVTQLWKDVLKYKAVEQGGEERLLDLAVRLGQSQSPLPSSPPPATQTTPATLQGRLWNQAYDNLKGREVRMVQIYEQILSAKLRQKEPSYAAHEEPENLIGADWETRSLQMLDLVQNKLHWMQPIGPTYPSNDPDFQEARTLFELANRAVHAVPEASVAWVGVSLGLQLLSSPSARSYETYRGLAYVLSRMELHWNLVPLFFADSRVAQWPPGLWAKVERPLLQLYELVLFYQIRSACICLSASAAREFQDAVQVYHLHDQLDGIGNAESRMDYFIEAFKPGLGCVRFYEPLPHSTDIDIHLQNMPWGMQGQQRRLEERLEALVKWLGPENGSTLGVISELGIICKYQGRLKEAAAFLERAARGHRKALQPEDWITLESMARLAEVYCDQERYEEAEGLAKDVADTIARLRRPEDLGVMKARSALASIYRQQGRLDDALRVLTMAKEVLGELHPTILIEMGNLSVAYRQQGRLQDARRLEMRIRAGMPR